MTPLGVAANSMIPKYSHSTEVLTKPLKIDDNYLTRLTSLELENEYKCLAKWRHDQSNTVSNPVAINDYKFEVRQKDCITFMSDWLTMFGEKLTNFDDRHEKLIVDLFIKGEYFQNKNFSNQGEPLAVRKFDIHKETRPASGMYWSYGYTNQLGIDFLVAKNPETGKIDTIKLEFTGHGIANFFPRNNHLNFVAMLELITALEPKLRATRLDTTIEVPHSMLSILGVKDAVDNRHFSGVKSAKPIYRIDEKYGYDGLSVYFGADGSHKLVRIYETGKKHGYHAVRIEVQNRGKYARLVCSELIKRYNEGLGLNKDNCTSVKPTDKQKESTAKALNEFIRDYVLSPSIFNLVDRNSKRPWKNRHQFTELPFWAKFKQDLKVGLYEVYFEPIEVTIQRKVKNMLRNLSGIHRLLSETIGKPAVDKIMRYFDIIHYGKYGGGFNESLNKAKDEIQALGASWIIELFDFETRCLLRNAGFYETPSPKVHYQGLQSVLELRQNNLKPTSHQAAIAF